MQNNVIKYILCAVFSLLLAMGAVLSAFTDSLQPAEGMIFPLIFLLAAIMTIAAYVNDRFLISGFLLQGKYVSYAVYCFILCMIVPLTGIALEYLVRTNIGLEHRIHNYLSPWILVDSLSTVVLLMVILTGMGVAEMYREWRSENEKLEIATHRYDEAISTLARRIKHDRIMKSFDRIIRIVKNDPEEANRELFSLSDRLRHDLYDLPRLNISAPYEPKLPITRSAEFISAKKYTFLRDICLKILIGCICLTAIFEVPDRPVFNMDSLYSFGGMFIVFCLLTYGNKSLAKHFLNRGVLKRYAIGGLIFLVTMTIVIIIVQIHSYNETIHPGSPSLIYSVLSTVATFAAVILYFSGITVLITLHNRIVTSRRHAALKADTAKAEFEFLQSQINPHFLFNVLNNAGILMYEEPARAIEMLSRLRDMAQYQNGIIEKKSVCLGEEMEFIRNYLLLEQSRKTPYIFEIDFDDRYADVKIPGLLLIPFVENASKHSSGSRDIRIRVAMDADRLRFECSNTHNPSHKNRTEGGLGVSNTRRRLELMYGNEASLDIERREDKYKVILIIPKYEMSDYR